MIESTKNNTEFDVSREIAVVVSNNLDFSRAAANQLRGLLGCRVEQVATFEELDLNQRLLGIIVDRNNVTEIKRIIRECDQRLPNCSIILCCKPSVAATLGDCFGNLNVELIHKPFLPGELELRLRKISLQKRRAAELEDSLQFIRQISDLNPELIYLFDVQAAMAVYVNRSLVAHFGCEPLGLEPQGRLFFGSVIHPDDRVRVQQRVAESLDGLIRGEFVTCEYRVKNSKGEWSWIRVRETVFESDREGKPLHILGVAQDITDSKQLTETMSWLSAIVDSADEAIIGKTLGGEIVSWNRSAEMLYGYKAEEICGKYISILLPDGAHDDVAEILQRVRNRERTERYQTRRKTKDGTVIDVSLNVSPVIDGDNRLVGASTIACRAK